MRMILASGSPRRKELLRELGVEFEIIKAVGEEVIHGSEPEEIVKNLAYQKALEVSEKIKDQDAIILAADTIVTKDGKILGKPRDEEDARAMIQMLSGKCHDVYTGVAILSPQGQLSFAEKTQVELYDLTHQEIQDYIATKAPYDKAGGYGIQEIFGKKFIKSISGDYYNVVGLPIARVYQELKHQGIDL